MDLSKCHFPSDACLIFVETRGSVMSRRLKNLASVRGYSNITLDTSWEFLFLAKVPVDV